MKRKSETFFLEGRLWGYYRLLLVIAVLIILVLVGRLFFERVDTTAVIENLRMNSDFFNKIPETILRAYAFSTSGRFFRYLFLPLMAFIGALLLAGLYVQRTYRLKAYRYGLRYMLAALFGFGYPRLVISEGKKQIKPGEINLLDVIGGPGYAFVHPGNAALVERLDGRSRVLSAGSHYINPLERVREVVSLEDQHGFIESVSVRTKDGIPVVVRDIHYRFRLMTGKEPENDRERTPEDPYPFSEVAVRAMAYNRAVRPDGAIPWPSAVQIGVQGAITGYIQVHKIDQLTAPGYDQEPRVEIARRLLSRGTKESLKNYGAELLWFDIGHFDIPLSEVKDQRVQTWGAEWTGNAEVTRAYGEAERIKLEEIGRAEGQAELLQGILGALQDVDLSSNTLNNVRTIMLLRTAQILESLSGAGQLGPGPQSGPANPPAAQETQKP